MGDECVCFASDIMGTFENDKQRFGRRFESGRAPWCTMHHAPCTMVHHAPCTMHHGAPVIVSSNLQFFLNTDPGTRLWRQFAIISVFFVSFFIFSLFSCF